MNLKCQKLNLFMVLHLMINDHVLNIPVDCACICLLSIVIESNLDSHRATLMFQLLFFFYIHRIQRNAHGHRIQIHRQNLTWWCFCCCCCLRFEMRYRHTYESECKAHMVQHLFQAKSLRYKYIFVCVT